ncbi:meiosis-specific nuclear structural protein 1 isoform X1 [Halyomorpha halys]|uniref:meiosis-specific nuclear structural protein 1 isoform X1 n=2 Tax=Halyomorpha halys TaxID=286706 RepID=UPI0006D4F9B8|nr:meiosis-specific nuclear structural protein 1-like [Halyomorpha halys]
MDTSKAPKAKAVDIPKNDRKEAEKVYLTKKAVNHSFLTRLHQERKEAETEAACANAKVSQGWRAEEVKQEHKLALEMLSDKYQWSKDMKLREIWKNSEEIKELQQKIKYAYLHKDMAIQLAEKKAQRLRRKGQEKDELLRMMELEKHLQELDVRNKMEEEQKKLKYKEELQDQMIDRQRMREEEYRALLDEKTFIDDAMKTISEEDRRDEELKWRRKKIAKEEAESILSAKKLWVEKEAKLQEEEDRKIREYLEDKDKKEKELQEAIKKKEEMRLQNKIACIKLIKSTAKENAERERITQILMDEDTRQKEEDKRRQELEKKLRDTCTFKEIIAKQMENHLQRLEEEKIQDIKFCQQLLEENNKATLREKELLARKHQENLEYGRALKCIVNQQHIEKLREMEIQNEQRKHEMKQIEKRRALLDEERRNLLKQHVGNLLGYLPKGVIRKEDLPYLDSEVRKFYEGQTQTKTD